MTCPASGSRPRDDGNLSAEPTEPIAADARSHADGKSNALLKLVAGVLGVNYDDLKHRTCVALLFPDEAYLPRLTITLLYEQSHEWNTSKIYLNMNPAEPSQT